MRDYLRTGLSLTIGCLIATTFFPSVPSAKAHEADNYTMPPRRELAELGRPVGQLFFGAMERAVEKANASIRQGRDVERLHSPDGIAEAVNTEFKAALFLIEGLDDRFLSDAARLEYPGTLPAYKDVRGVRRYAENPLYPLRAWGCATIQTFGVHIGTDKIGHFTDMGMHYFRNYREAARAGKSEREARLAGVHVGTDGPFSEKAVLGWATAGAYSNADLVSNYTGMLFYENLYQPVELKGVMRPAMLERDGAAWRLAPHVRGDGAFFGWFVSEHFDESLNPSVYLEHMRPGIRRAIKEAGADLLDVHRDANGNRRSRDYFAAQWRELSTYYGWEYGHLGDEKDLLTIDRICFATPPEKRPGVRDAQGWTALHHAAAAGDVDAVRQLLDAGEDANTRVRSAEVSSPEWGNTPLHYAARDGRTEAMRLLISRKADVNARNDRGATPLHRAIGSAAAVELLVASGAKIDAADERGLTPLHWATRDPQAKPIAALLTHGASATAKATDGSTPLHLAVRAGREDAAGMLLAAGADPNAPSRFGMTPLHLAARFAPDLGPLLLARGASADLADAFGCTPLFDAARFDDERLVAALLTRGAKANQADAYGFTPLHLAGRSGNESLARLLMDRGADTHARSASGSTPIDEAARAGHARLAQQLRSAMQPVRAAEVGR